MKVNVRRFLVLVSMSFPLSGCAVFDPPPSYTTSPSRRFQIEEPRWKREWREGLERPSPVKAVLWQAASIAGSEAARRQ